MATASQFPITTKYGWVKDYPLHTSKYDPIVPLYQRAKYPGKGYGFHTGVDRAMPTGTPIYLNNLLIGLSGSTGASTGPHLHIGRFLLGVCTDPGKRGFSYPLHGIVVNTGYDSSNGNYVRVRSYSSGAIFVYLHLSKVYAKAGQRF
jgi:murein DD-endopeptidase MepM/ murein hydrolase activator NlpD